MPSYLYYRRGGEWVRVNADSFTQVPQPGGLGQCSDSYTLSVTFNGTRVSTNAFLGPFTRTTATATGPITGIVGVNPNLGSLQGGYVWGVRFRAGNLTGASWPSGVYVSPNSSLGVQLGVSATDPYKTGFLSGNGGGGGFIVNPINITNVSYTRLNGQADNCGVPTCQTIFKLGNSTVLTLSTCPEISEGPNACSDCCAQLLPIARSISI